MGPWPNVLNAYATAILHTIDFLKFQHPNYSAPSRALIAFYSKVEKFLKQKSIFFGSLNMWQQCIYAITS